MFYREKKNSITISNLRRLIQSVQTVLLCVSICSENSICALSVPREKEFKTQKRAGWRWPKPTRRTVRSLKHNVNPLSTTAAVRLYSTIHSTFASAHARPHVHVAA